MALSPWTIPDKTENTARKTRFAQGRAPQNRGASFASVMAEEQSAKAAQKNGQAAQVAPRKMPQVARLPETQGLPLRSGILAGRTPNELLRAQNFGKARADLAQTRAMDGLMQACAGGATTLDVARGLGMAKNLRVIAANNNGRGFALTSSDFIRTRNSNANNAARTERTRRSRRSRTRDTGGIGRLSAQFESGREGIAAIGYDSAGGTSYGKYQIASRVGSMKNFLEFLDGEAPDLSKRLRKAGPANTGSRRGAMPNEWRAIAREQPERFEKLQESFINQSHYQPALDAIAQCTGIDASSLSAAMREVIWSTAVQHGPAGAARIFARADDMSGKASEASYERKLINNVYALRAGQFGSSSHQVRAAVLNRFRQEKQLALNMLDGTRANLA